MAEAPARRKYVPAHERYAYGGPLRRFESLKPTGHGVTLSPDHPAAVEGRTLFRGRAVHPDTRPRVLIDGHNSRKIGGRVMKGAWRGFPIFTLTLEERATCPRSCEQWLSCYGNGMRWPSRLEAGPALEKRLWEDLEAKQKKHPAGFVVRLHVLGDFYSTDYVDVWAEALDTFPALRVFGYTAHPIDSPIGTAIRELIGLHPDRFKLRFSGLDAPEFGAVVADSADDTQHLVCPAQTGKTDCCATCALCWSTDRTIAFLKH